jgi:ABC-2 type transport system permease protein
MKRYIRLYVALLQLNFHALLSYRANLVNSAIASIGWGIISIVSMYILTAKNSSIYGWNRNELLLLTGVYSVSIGIFHTIFSRNFDRFSRVIHDGDLDGMLLKPVDSQFSLSFTLFNFMSVTRLLIGLSFTIYILFLLHVQLTIMSLLGFIFFLLLGVYLPHW